MHTERPYITARRMAEALGVPVADVIADMRSPRPWTINGGKVGELWLVHSYELGAERLERHLARLASTSSVGLEA